jgi:type IV pilus assembly protein PilO
VLSVKKNMADLDREINSLTATTKKLEDLRLQAAECEKKFPKDEEIPALLENISATAAKSGVDIIAIRPIKAEFKEEAQRPPDLFHAIAIEIVAKGGYHQLGQFINRLETSARFMEVKDIDINRDPANPRRHDLKLLIATYILRT